MWSAGSVDAARWGPYTRRMSYALRFAVIGLAFLLIGVLGIVIFDAIWMRIGLGAAVVIVVGGLLFFAWRQDQKARESRAGLERI